MTVMPSRTITRSVDADPAAVHAYIADPRNLPEWAPGFAQAVEATDDGWIVDTGSGTVPVRFAPADDHGIADHWVTLPTGVEAHNAVRVIANGTGTEIVFTFFQTDDMTPDDLAEAAGLVTEDLRTLQQLLEG